MPNPLLTLSPNELRNIAEQIRQGRVSLPFTPTSLSRLIPAKLALEITAALNALLKPEGCLELLAQSREESRPLSAQLEIVTSGTEDSAADTRRTAIVMENLFREAQHTILISGYNIWDGKELLAPLTNRLRQNPGIQIEFYLNISTSPEAFQTNFKRNHWPADLPVPPIYYLPASLLADRDPNKAVLHSKCLIVDTHKVFLTSANLTEAAQTRNIELGVIFSNSSLARQKEEFFQHLREQRILLKV